MEPLKLIELAMEAREHAYAPYSNYTVGAALLTKAGKVYQGCNIENASYGLTVCAERNAFFKAVYEGEREFEALAVIGGPAGEKALTACAGPCGACRQVIAEFCEADFKIYLTKGDGEYLETSLRELLPLTFTKGDLGM